MGKDTFFSSFTLRCGTKLVEYSKPCIMGILNVTPDSFYDGGRYDTISKAVEHAQKLVADGADIIDIGVCSTRPEAQLLPPDEEARRLSEVVRAVRDAIDKPISIDTCYSLPAQAGIEAGADIVNDISGGQFDDKMLDTIADLKVPYILCHTKGKPDTMDNNTNYDDVTKTLISYFSEKLEHLYKLGIADVIIDQTFGFAKDTRQNYELLHNIPIFKELFKEPLLVALSRKRMIYEPLGITAQDAIYGTVAANTIALQYGAQILRVHDPRPALHAVEITTQVQQASALRTP